jgi:hypothetical protein
MIYADKGKALRVSNMILCVGRADRGLEHVRRSKGLNATVEAKSSSEMIHLSEKDFHFSEVNKGTNMSRWLFA